MSLYERVLAEVDTASLARGVKRKILQMARVGRGRKLVKLDVRSSAGRFCLIGTDEVGQKWKAACESDQDVPTADDWLLFLEGNYTWSNPRLWKKYTPKKGALPAARPQAPRPPHMGVREKKYRGREGIRQWVKDRIARDRLEPMVAWLERTPLLAEGEKAVKARMQTAKERMAKSTPGALIGLRIRAQNPYLKFMRAWSTQNPQYRIKHGKIVFVGPREKRRRAKKIKGKIVR